MLSVCYNWLSPVLSLHCHFLFFVCECLHLCFLFEVQTVVGKLGFMKVNLYLETDTILQAMCVCVCVYMLQY